MENFRSRKMGLLLYPDDVTHIKAIELIKSYQYAIILHDSDTDSNGEILKLHYHVVLHLKNAQWCTAIAKELGIKENYIQQIRNEEAALEYLIHYNDDDKYKYSVENVKGPLQKKLIEYINKSDVSESEKVVIMIENIEQQQKYMTITEFAKYCASAGYWDVFRRSGTIFCKIIEENNYYYCGKI